MTSRTLLSANLHALRIANDYSQERLAESLGVNRVTLARWESGSVWPTPEHLDELAKLLNVPVAELFRSDRGA